jgi:uncharacterized protein YjbJ (UPF0337 family)
MNWDRMEGAWKQRRGKAVHHWGKVMNDDLAAIAGKYEELVGRLQERYGIAKEEAREQVKEFKKTIEQLKKSNSRLLEMQKALSTQKKAHRKPVTSKPSPTQRPRSRAGKGRSS